MKRRGGAEEGDGMAYVIETRTPETEERAAGPWHSDGMGDGEIIVDSLDEYEATVERLRSLGQDWEAAEYRAVEVDR